MSIASIDPNEARRLIAQGASLIDIRPIDEYAREQIPGAVHLPLERVGDLDPAGKSVIFHCRTGMRTEANAALLQAAARGADCYLLGGGIEAWRSVGLPTRVDSRQPIDIMRQVQLIAGGLVASGSLLALLVAPAFALLPAFVGTGLMLAGASGWCGMALLLRRMPWNRRAQAS